MMERMYRFNKKCHRFNRRSNHRVQDRNDLIQSGSQWDSDIGDTVDRMVYFEMRFLYWKY